ncbi:helix-turn-helix domain-containing protein [Streptomyces inhibens]|uniref:helix-turn-helix domain-containing protein n=1 Tax=Streptomyces inhibens TaxID=2293571 RepID=UPI00402ABAA2
MNTATVPEPRTAAALAARRRKTEAALERVHQAIARLRREKAQVSVADVARRADVSRTFLHDNVEAGAASPQRWLRPANTNPARSLNRTTNAKRPGANAP